MLYSSTKELPDEIKVKLSEPAQEVYLKIFNESWKEYGSPHLVNSNDAEARMKIAHDVAWAAANKLFYDNESNIVEEISDID